MHVCTWKGELTITAYQRLSAPTTVLILVSLISLLVVSPAHGVSCRGRVSHIEVTPLTQTRTVRDEASVTVNGFDCNGDPVDGAVEIIISGLNPQTESGRTPFTYSYQSDLFGEEQIHVRVTTTVGFLVDSEFETAFVTWNSFANEEAGEESVPASENDALEFIEAAKALLAERYGGGWVESTANQQTVVNLGIVDLSPQDRQTLEALAPPRVIVSPVPATYGLTRLVDDFLPKVDAVIEADQSGDVAAWGPQPSINKLEIQLQRPNPQLTANITNAVPADAIQITIAAGASGEATDTRRTYPPYKAGRASQTQNRAYGSCTLGFAMQYVASGTRHFYGSTAGHCAYNNDTILIEGTSTAIGQAFNNVWPDSSTSVYTDAALTTLYNQSASSDDIFINPDFSRDVIGKVTDSTMSETGVQLCQSVKSSGVGCGNITYPFRWRFRGISVRNPNGTQRTQTYYNAVCFKEGTIGGDSGGPVYRSPSSTQARAAGLIWGNWRDGNGVHHSCLHTISSVELATGAYLRTE